MPISKASGQAVAPAAKGDLVVGSATNDAAVLAVGSADQVLTVDSSTTTGLKWATPSSGGMTLLSTTTLTGASVSISSIPATYVNLFVMIRNFRPATDGSSLNMKFNAHTTYRTSTTADTGNFADAVMAVSAGQDNGASNHLTYIEIPNYAGTTWKMAEWYSLGNNQTTSTNGAFERAIGQANLTSAIDTLVFATSSGNFTSGTVLVYGVK